MKYQYLLSLFLLAPLANGTTLLNVDFQSDTVGELPAQRSSQTNIGSPNTVAVVDGTSTPPDPFGPAGNKSLYMNAPVGSSSSAGIWFTTQDDTLVAHGSFQTQIYMVNESRFLDLRLGQLDPGIGTGRISEGSSLIRLLVGSGNGTNTISVYQNGNSGTVVDQTFAFDTTLNLSIDWQMSGGDIGYSVSLNGTPLTISGVSLFDFYNTSFMLDGEPVTIEGVNGLQYRTGGAEASNYEYFVNSLSVSAIPEQGHVGLLIGLIGLLFAGSRKLRGRTVRK